MTQKTLNDLKEEADRLNMLANKDANSDISVLAKGLETICRALMELDRPSQERSYPQSTTFRNQTGR